MARSKNSPAIRLTFTATQGSADAFVEAEITTGLSTLDRSAYRILEIGVQLPGIPAVNGANLEVSLSRQSQAAIAAMNDRSLLFRESAYLALATSGVAYQNTTRRWQPIDAANLIVVEETLYFQLDSSGTSNANTVKGYILVDLLSVSEADKVALIAQSLGNF